MTDARFDGFPTDARFPSPGVDTYHDGYPTDAQFDGFPTDAQFPDGVFPHPNDSIGPENPPAGGGPGPTPLPVEPTWRFWGGDLALGPMTGRQWDEEGASGLNFRIPVGNDAVPEVVEANGFVGVRFHEDQQTTANPRLELYDGETPFSLEPGCTVFVVYTGETDEPGRYRVMMGNQESANDSQSLAYRCNGDSFNAYLDDLDGWTVRLHHDDTAVNAAVISSQPAEAAIGTHVIACRGTRLTWETIGAANETYLPSVLNGSIHEVVLFDRASAPTDQEMTDTVAALMAAYGVTP